MMILNILILAGIAILFFVFIRFVAEGIRSYQDEFRR